MSEPLKQLEEFISEKLFEFYVKNPDADYAFDIYSDQDYIKMWKLALEYKEQHGEQWDFLSDRECGYIFDDFLKMLEDSISIPPGFSLAFSTKMCFLAKRECNKIIKLVEDYLTDDVLSLVREYHADKAAGVDLD